MLINYCQSIDELLKTQVRLSDRFTSPVLNSNNINHHQHINFAFDYFVN